MYVCNNHKSIENVVPLSFVHPVYHDSRQSRDLQLAFAVIVTQKEKKPIRKFFRWFKVTKLAGFFLHLARSALLQHQGYGSQFHFI
jgi:hypothetical protein